MEEGGFGSIDLKHLLQKQIDLFLDWSLGRLAVSSQHGAKYEELKKIVSQWR